jgi:hypothetical protein
MSIFDTVLSPRITTMIRLDHTHVLAAFHRYSADTAPSRKAAIVNAACGALEIHAKLEEVFLPSFEKDSITETALDKSVPEHDEMRATIAELGGMSADSPRFDELFMKLMREVIHHVADEETILLPPKQKAEYGSATSVTWGCYEPAALRIARRVSNENRRQPSSNIPACSDVAGSCGFLDIRCAVQNPPTGLRTLN